MKMASIEEIKDERGKLRKFIKTYRDLPVLWDVKSVDYTKKDKRNKAYDILLKVFRAIKYDATVEDVKKKINSMRSNFRKELKKVVEAAVGATEYRPSSWMYEELLFLKELENPGSCTKSPFATIEDIDMSSHNETSHTENMCSGYPDYSPAKVSRYSEYKQNEAGPLMGSFKMIYDTESDITRVWASKLKCLNHTQRLYAEKAINDILFEAQLGTLRRNSGKINEYPQTAMTTISSNLGHGYQHFEPLQSSAEYKYSETEKFKSDNNCT